MANHSTKSERRFGMVQRIISTAGFSVLAGLFGFGLTWIGVGIIANIQFQTRDQGLDFAAKSMPVLIAGGIVGFVAGLVFSLKIAKRDPIAVDKLEKEYVGTWGRVKIFLGFSALVAVLMTPVFERLPHLVGEKYFVYVVLGIVLAIIALSLFLYDRIPKRWVMPIGIVSWLLTLSWIVWYYFFGPGAFGHGTFGSVLFLID